MLWGGSLAVSPKICILNESDARTWSFAGIAHRCASRRHHHYTKGKVEEMVESGELVWVGKHKRVATFLLARSWIKMYVRNAAGEVSYCTMQLVRGGGGY